MTDPVLNLPGLQPKKIGGKLEFPLDMPLPEKRITECPACGSKEVYMLNERAPTGQHFFKCRSCHAKFYQNIVMAYCSHKKKPIRPIDCRGCEFFEIYFKLKKECPYFVPPKREQKIPEGFEKM